MDDIATILAKNLRKLRDKAGLTQSDLAEKANVSMGTVQAYEGKRRWPELPYLEALAKALGVPAFELFSVPSQLSPTMDYLLKALKELETENQKLKRGLPYDFLQAWHSASEVARKMALGVLLADSEPRSERNNIRRK